VNIIQNYQSISKMSKLRVAILEDDKLLLKNLKSSLEETALVEVVEYASSSSEFIAKVKESNPEALLLDIDLGSDSMSGIDVANMLKLPVLFVSGKTVEFNSAIEELNLNLPVTIQHITKPITVDKLSKILPKLINDINSLNRSQFVWLDFKGSTKNKISIDTIVYIETETGASGASNNKRIYFTNRVPETICNVSLKRIEDIGLDPKKFVFVRSSHRVNIDKILKYEISSHEVLVEVCSIAGKTECKRLSVSENFRKQLRMHKE
jgi:DNA-binding LytR/AlgR family response regulator